MVRSRVTRSGGGVFAGGSFGTPARSEIGDLFGFGRTRNGLGDADLGQINIFEQIFKSFPSRPDFEARVRALRARWNSLMQRISKLPSTVRQSIVNEMNSKKLTLDRLQFLEAKIGMGPRVGETDTALYAEGSANSDRRALSRLTRFENPTEGLPFIEKRLGQIEVFAPQPQGPAVVEPPKETSTLPTIPRDTDMVKENGGIPTIAIVGGVAAVGIIAAILLSR